MQDERSVAVAASTSDRNASGTVPVCFLDEKGRLLFAPSITLTEQDGARRGSVTIRGSRAWQAVRSVVVPASDAATKRQPIGVVPLRWGEPIAVNIPDAQQGSMPSYGNKEPRKALTRAFQVRADRNGDGTAKLTLDVVSIDGVHEFCLDLAAALLGPVRRGGRLRRPLDQSPRRVEARRAALRDPPGQAPRGRRPGIRGDRHRSRPGHLGADGIVLGNVPQYRGPLRCCRPAGLARRGIAADRP